MRTLRHVGLLMVAFTGACVPSRAARTAGQIGCTPEEIMISNEESHVGLMQSGETWMAECQGRTFVCSQINESGRDKSFLDSLFVSGQVSCHEAPESREAEQNRHARAAAAVERANRPPSKPPTGAAGFDFGETPDDAAQRCEAAGQVWGSDGGKRGCSGPAASLGLAARVYVGFCGGRACLFTIEHVPRASWAQSSLSLKARLETKYGSAQESSGLVPEHCRSERAFARCIESEQLTLRYTWRWPGGESLEMSVGTRDHTEGAAIRLVYRRLGDAANLSAL